MCCVCCTVDCWNTVAINEQEQGVPGDPASLHKAGRVSPPLPNRRITAGASASSLSIRVVRTVPLPVYARRRGDD